MWAAAALALFAPLLRWCWPYIGWPAALLISKETTFITAPIDRTGYVDYVAYVKQQYVDAGGQPVASAPWLTLKQFEGDDQLRPAGLPDFRSAEEAFEESQPETLNAPQQRERLLQFVDEQLPRLHAHPWGNVDYPEVAQCMEENSRWYDYVVRTLSPISAAGFPAPAGNPWDNTLANVLLPGTQLSREFSRRFLLRAAFRFGESQPLAAMEDIAFVHKITSREQMFLIALLVRISIETEAARTAAIGVLNVPEPTTELLHRIEGLPRGELYGLLKTSLHYERLMYLDQIMKIRQTGNFDGCFIVDFSSVTPPESWLLARRLYAGVDWNAVMRHENDLIDGVLQEITKHSFPVAYPKLRALRAPPGLEEALGQVQGTDFAGKRPNTEHFKCILQSKQEFDRAYAAATALILHRRVVQLCMRLALWKHMHREFPDQLAQLQSIRIGSRSFAEISTDPFTESPIQYNRTSTGFEIVSGGADGISGPATAEHFSDTKDVGWEQATGDYVWKWPVYVAPPGAQ